MSGVNAKLSPFLDNYLEARVVYLSWLWLTVDFFQVLQATEGLGALICSCVNYHTLPL